MKRIDKKAWALINIFAAVGIGHFILSYIFKGGTVVTDTAFVIIGGAALFLLFDHVILKRK